MELEANTRLQDTTFSFGYHLTLPQANMVFRGEGHWGNAGRHGGPRGSPLLLRCLSPSPVNHLVRVLPPGLVDSNWCVGAVLEKKMPPLPVTLALGAFLNHWRNRSHCGFSVTVG